MKKFLKSFALAGALGLSVVGPAAAALEVQLTSPDFAGSEFSGLATVGHEFILELSVTGLHSAGLDLSDSISLTAVIGTTEGSPFLIGMYNDPNTDSDFSTDSLGNFFSEFVTPSVAAVPGVENSAQGLFFTFSLFDPEDPARVISIPDSGVLARFVVRSPAVASPGSWGIVAAVGADDEDGFGEPVSSDLAGMTTTLVPVPEPETYAMFGAGLVMLGLSMVRRRVR